MKGHSWDSLLSFLKNSGSILSIVSLSKLTGTHGEDQKQHNNETKSELGTNTLFNECALG